MKVEISIKFQKQLDALDDLKTRKKVEAIIDEISKSDGLAGIKHLKKISTHKNYYRIRLENYRIGIALLDDVVVFAAFDRRSNIYKHFP